LNPSAMLVRDVDTRGTGNSFSSKREVQFLVVFAGGSRVVARRRGTTLIDATPVTAHAVVDDSSSS